MSFPKIHQKIYSIFCEDLDRKTTEKISKLSDQIDNKCEDLDRKTTEKISKLSDQIGTTLEYNENVTNTLASIKSDLKKCSSSIDLLKSVENISEQTYVPYEHNEKIRIVFLFQAASFWPSWEYFYKACVGDPEYDVHFMLLDELYGDTTQMRSAKEFLNKLKITYKIYSDRLFDEIMPHVLVIQTPYDEWHRNWYYHTDIFRKRGVRIVYISYGIESTDTEEARYDQFMKGVNNCWRIYTYNDVMRRDYLRYCPNSLAIRSTGHPKFDSLYYDRGKYDLPSDVKDKINGRKVVLWHLHFPKFIPCNTGFAQSTPYLKEYVDFLEYIKKEQSLFFIIQMHPKFYDTVLEKDNIYAEQIKDIGKYCNNVYFDKSDDYRPVLVSADYIITDRSSLMVESAVVDVPICYMSNCDYQEPLAEGVKPLIESYEQGNYSKDMVDFIEKCKIYGDTNREKRNLAFKKCIIYDGMCSIRIKDDITKSLKTSYSNRLSVLEDKIDTILRKIDK